MQVFGFEIKKRAEEKTIPSIVKPENRDGAIVVDSSINAGGMFSYGVDMDGVVKTENDEVKRYREISIYPEVDFAIGEICDEAIVTDQDEKIVSLNLDELKVSDSIKKKIESSFDEVLDLLDFKTDGHDIFRQWYVDGKLFYHILFRNNNIKEGIAEVRLVDPLKIKKIKNIKRERNDKGIEIVKEIEEYYLYNDRGIHEGNLQGIKLTLDSVALVSSGLIDFSNGMTVGHLKKAIKPTNQLKMLEDAVVIFRLSRAPERRIFYIDVGSMPKIKAEQYVQDMMNKFKNKLVYDAKTGELADSKKHLSMMEDFWMPRRDGGKGTEITTLPGVQNLGQLEDVDYFLNKLYRSLNVPISRLKQETGFSIGRSNEISRDEIRFSKFVDRLRSKFSDLFLDLLRIQLIAKGIITDSDWREVKSKIKFDFARDNHFTELKEAEIINNRLQSLLSADALVGRYISKKWVQKKILRLTDDELDEMEREMNAEPVQIDPNAPNPQQGKPQEE